MSALALDLGSACGWALTDGVTTECGTETLKHPRKDKGCDDSTLWWRLETFLDAVHADRHLESIAYEEVPAQAAKGRQAVLVFGMRAIVQRWAMLHCVVCKGIGPGSWKKKSIGKGNATKDEIMAEIKRQGYQPKTQDEADAIGVLNATLGGVSHEVRDFKRAKPNNATAKKVRVRSRSTKQLARRGRPVGAGRVRKERRSAAPF